MFVSSLCLSLFAAVSASSGIPGRALFWVPSSGVRPVTPEYNTVSSSPTDVSQLVNEYAQAKEMLVVFCDSNSNNYFSHPEFASSISQSRKSQALSNVYTTGDTSGMCQQIRESLNVIEVTLEQLQSVLQQSPEILSNNVLDTYLVSLNNQDFSDMSSIHSSLASVPSAAVFLQEASAHIPSSVGNYARLLETVTDPNDPLYLPEGTEYSIYYAAQYLYITPDIFTGIMTGLFMFFTMYIGYSCLGAIQGGNAYPKKMPTLGKEG